MKHTLVLISTLLTLFLSQLSFACYSCCREEHPWYTSGYQHNNCECDSCEALCHRSCLGCLLGVYPCGTTGECGSCNCTDPSCGCNPCLDPRTCCQVFGNIGASDFDDSCECP